MPQANTPHVEINLLSNQLAQAAVVTLRLTEAGVNVLAAVANGRRPVLMVDRIPDGVQSVTKRSHRNGMGGTTVIDAAVFHGCQLEAMRDVPGEWPRPARGAHLQGVPNG